MNRTISITFRSALAFAAAGTLSLAHGEDSKSTFGAASWVQYGQIAKSLDTAEQKVLDGKGMLGTGAQFAIKYQANEHLEVNAGLGVGGGHNIAARNIQGFYAPYGVGPYVANANMKYSFWNEDDRKLQVQVGLFPYDYLPDAQNLGLYLMRGPVYPGLLQSGFETKYVLPVANTLGFAFSHQSGIFSHDLLFTFDSDWYPYWDITPMYIASVKAGSAFRVGAGVSLYHWIPVDSKLTSKKTPEVMFIDTVPLVDDTSYISFAGTKVMGNFSFDPKALFGGIEALGPEDLKLYGEVAVLGLDNTPAHKALYGPISERMPIMVGFNLPAFKLLDRLNVEVESYKARWVDDPSIYNHTSGPQVTPIPKKSARDTNTTADNFKWSIYGSRVVADHVKISAQVASDHFRPGIFQGYGDNNPPLNNVPFFSAKEFYWTFKVAYFF